MQAITDPVTPLEAGGEMFERASKTQSFLFPRSSLAWPLPAHADLSDTDFEDDGSVSDDDDYSPKGSFETDDRRRSQTTISSYDEAPTPRSSRSHPHPFELRLKPVEGPKGPHLFRASQVSSRSSSSFDDYSLQMSPLLPRHPPPLRADTAFSDDTVTPVTRHRDEDIFSIAAALTRPAVDAADSMGDVRGWTPQQVIDWAYACNVDASVIECFMVHDVDGRVLLDLQFDDLKELDIQSFGKRHQLWNALCDLKGEERMPSPQPTPFEDISRPCTASHHRSSPSHSRHASDTLVDGDGGKKRRGRKAPKPLDVITPAESVSIVAIEQLLPKPHKCAKGERCAKWRKQQRELEQLDAENGLGRFPISPTKGGRIFVHGDPGNATTADNMIPNVRKQPPHTPPPVPDSPFGPTSEIVPSIVASSDLLGPGQLPEFALQADVLDKLDKRDPQDNVRQFLNFQHLQSPAPPLDDDDTPSTPLAGEPPHHHQDPMPRATTVPPLFPEQHYPAYPSLQALPTMPAPHENLRTLPKLDIPRSATADPNFHSAVPAAANPAAAAAPASALSLCRSATASPGGQPVLYRLGTPASEMDVPLTAEPLDAIERNTCASVPPNMQYRPQLGRSHSRAADWRRPSNGGLPAVKEGEVFSPASDAQSRPSISSSSSRASSDSKATAHCSGLPRKVADPAHHSPTTRHFGYGADCAHAGWMKKRKTKMLRHEWQDAHCRLRGTQLGMYESARLSALAKETINVDHYAVACSSVASSNKLSAAMKAFHLGTHADHKKLDDPTAFAFQLVPQPKDGEARKHVVSSGKTHHFAVKNKDERIDWMRELMLAKALQAKGQGFEVEINGVHVA